jgi:hypothetical protein
LIEQETLILPLASERQRARQRPGAKKVPTISFVTPGLVFITSLPKMNKPGRDTLHRLRRALLLVYFRNTWNPKPPVTVAASTAGREACLGILLPNLILFL